MQQAVNVRAKLLRGFLIEKVKVEPLRGLVTIDNTPQKISPESLDVLLHLASEPGVVVLRTRLIDQVWGKENGNGEVLDQAVEELLQVLEKDPENTPFIEILPGHGYRLNKSVKVMNFSGPEIPDSPATLPSHLPLREIQSDAPLLDLTFWQELKQRRVVRVGIAYLLIAWGVLEVADVVFPALGAPEWSMKLLTLLLAVGFVITLVIAWLIQITPEGLVLEPGDAHSKGGNLRHLIELTLILVLLVGVSVLVYRQTWIEPPLPPPTMAGTPSEFGPPIPMPEYEKSIAVLPFVNLGEKAEDQYFGYGLAEELLHKLTRIKALKVAARTSSFAIADRGLEIPAIAKRLGVMTVLEGSFRRSQGKTRITAQLVDADGFHLWSEVYDRNSGETLNIQSNIALSVVKRILSDINSDTTAWLNLNQTSDPDALDAYLRGLEYLRMPRQPETLTKATEKFELAIEFDPRFARAWAASCETELSWFRLNRDSLHFERAEKQCNRALTLDSESPEVYTALGNLYRTSSQFETAQQHFEQALEINPYSENASYGLSRSLQGLGDLKGAEQMLRFGIELEPGYWGPHMGLGNFLFRLGRYEEAAEQYVKVTVLTPENPDGFTNLGAALFDSMHWDDAEIAWEVSLELNPTPMAYRNMGTIYYYQGRYEEAADMHQHAIDLAPNDHWLWGKLAATYHEMKGQEVNSQEAYQKAITLASERLQIEPNDSPTMAYLAAYFANIGEEEKAWEMAVMAKQLEPENPEIWYFSALVNTHLQEHSWAMEDIAKAVELGYSTRLLAADPQLSGLSDLEEFQRLIR